MLKYVLALIDGSHFLYMYLLFLHSAQSINAMKDKDGKVPDDFLQELYKWALECKLYVVRVLPIPCICNFTRYVNNIHIYINIYKLFLDSEDLYLIHNLLRVGQHFDYQKLF